MAVCSKKISSKPPTVTGSFYFLLTLAGPYHQKHCLLFPFNNVTPTLYKNNVLVVVKIKKIHRWLNRLQCTCTHPAFFFTTGG